MATINILGQETVTEGDLPPIGSTAPDFSLTAADFSEVTLSEYRGKTVVLNIFMSVETTVCEASIRRFNELASSRPNVVVLCISADLPFSLSKFCAAEGLSNVIPLSTFRSPGFGADYGVRIASGPDRGLMSRAVVIVGPDGTVIHEEHVPEISHEPNYEAALKAFD